MFYYLVICIFVLSQGTPPLTGFTSVVITITDVNNKPPVFTPASHSVGILENTTVGLTVFTYTAVDPDENALLRYSLLGDLVNGRDENGQNIEDKDYLRVSS